MKMIPIRGGTIIVDDADAEFVMSRTWRVSSHAKTGRCHTSYAQSQVYIGNRKCKGIVLHRVLWERWGLGPAGELDHINRNGLDCRRENLRSVTHVQNLHNRDMYRNNTSGFPGVRKSKTPGRWVAEFQFNGVRRSLGTFLTKTEAFSAYVAAKEAIAPDPLRVDIRALPTKPDAKDTP